MSEEEEEDQEIIRTVSRLVFVLT